ESLGDREEAARWFGRAVAKALAGGEFERAMELAEKLAQVTKGAERARAELHVVDALFRAGRAAEAKDRLERIHLDGVTDMGVRLEARVLTLAIAATLRHLPSDHDPSLVVDADAYGDLSLRIETRLAAARLVRGRRGLVLAEEAIALAAESPLELRYRALAMRHELLAEVDPSDVARLQRATELVRAAARELGSPWAELDADNSFACARSNAGDFATALPLFESISARAKQFKFGTLEREVLVNTATTYLRSGDPARAAAAAALAADAARAAGNADLLMGAQSVRADALTQTGDLAAAKAAADEAIEVAMSGGQDYYATVTLLRRAEIRSRLGDPRAEEDAAHARKRAESVADVDLVTRAEVWSALHHARNGVDGAIVVLAEIVRAVDARQAPLRAPTKRSLDEARRLVGASSTR
ncbi:MAG TPA: hypothetical protein VM694_21920, partial [Polyangium sp.]|nr:hypothetical protein [Polyangium sp.]